MLLPGLPMLSALLVLLLAAGRCATTAALLRVSGAGGRAEGRSLLELAGRHSRVRLVPETGARGSERTHRGLDVHSHDPQQKAKFLRHLTGPLYFHPKCKRSFDRIYHRTRDCTTPAFFMRCARLLTQLAKSPRCKER
ncbi:ALK and LTK ligand 2b [Nelusetta ayraudi]|uniref:ALK and LTK ligand 2b n=1 Tax=Nelusetta ayraudi TaxID=303726 RepID=UPI003F6F37B5